MSEEFQHIYQESDQWLNDQGPDQHVVVSSRARLARNLSRIPFATHAKKEELEEVTHLVTRTIQDLQSMKSYLPINLHKASTLERRYLKESHIISSEMEKGDVHRLVYIRPDYRNSIMVNEEDHLRIQGLVSGFRLQDVFREILNIDMELMDMLPIAFSDLYGYLTACPTNLGTGLRVSVMLHLPGLTLSRKIEEALQMIQPRGVAVRGFYGENSEYLGDFYQVASSCPLQRFVSSFNNAVSLSFMLRLS